MKKSLQIVICVLSFYFSVGAWAQSNAVSGKIVDENGQGAPGVSILLKGTTVGTTTDSNGNFTLSAPSDGVLVVSMIGYSTQEVPVSNQTSININLKLDVKTLNEVVVVGYGEQKKETLTGAVTAIQGRELVKSPQANLSNSFAGRMPGVIASTPSGEPGSDASRILIRGQATIGDNSPLVVIDGVANRLGGLDRINPNDVESISVLKDGSAAIYGAQAANGVILITTKRGKTGKAVFNYSYNQGFVTPTRLPKMASSATYATMLNEIDTYNGATPRYSADDIAKFANGSDPVNHPNTNWVKELIKPVTLQNQHNLSVRGGTEKVSYFLSLGKLHQDGIYKNAATKYDQYSLRSNIDVQVNDAFKIGFDINGRQENRVYPVSDAGTIFRAAYRTYPFIPLTNPNGSYSAGVEQGLNPLVLATDAGGTSENPRSVINATLRGSYKLPFLEGLSADGFLAIDKIFDNTKRFQKPWATFNYNSTDKSYTYVQGGPNKPLLDQSHANASLYTANIKLNYARQFGKHNISSFVAYEQSVQLSDTLGTTRRNYFTTILPELSNGGADAADVSNYGSSFRKGKKKLFCKNIL